MKIPTSYIKSFEQVASIFQMTSDQVHYTRLILQFAFHLQKFRVHQRRPVLLSKVTPNNYINHAEFVFKGYEGDA
ncbi:hypothetical protein TMS3_0103920 [Pseudomonas taeanensis MS-3]|uniref:Uncharacterized protein n=1 Tax=Pseudomonas taeanensis MS-3 TaxID=1395571 RepID=A0A0A1YQ14_9PSED|nr:hypothetical protein TMS3_0103920 [Pseudomonas taeanensis MS-3]